MNKSTAIILMLMIPFGLISQELKNPFFIKADFSKILDYNKKPDPNFDIIDNIYVGKFITKNLVLGITTNNTKSGVDPDRYVPIYSLSEYQFFSMYYLNITDDQMRPFLFLKRPFKFKDETYEVFNTDGIPETIVQPFDFFNQLNVGLGISIKLVNNLFIDVTYYQLLQKTIYGFNNGITSFGIHYELGNQ